MAALSEANGPLLLDLRQLRPDELDPLLEEEIALWRTRLDWDFRPSADLVRRFVRMQALNGQALVAGRVVVGYVYFVCEDRKGLVGDLYLAREYATPENETFLLGAALKSLRAFPRITRIESQLMMLSDAARRALPFANLAKGHRRNFMMFDLGGGPLHSRLPPGPAAAKYRFDPWHEREQEEAARLIARAYQGHIDGEINDQYRSIAGARRFLMNIVQYPGCGSFFQPASIVAFEPETGHLTGLSLASLVAFDVGHITQICVDPAVKRTGVGYEMLRLSLEALARSGCRRVSLTVTAGNDEAVRLYQRMGFRIEHTFDAIIWENVASHS
jgi:ribosomal protein S18 acetylase RimI-like enzyme